MSNLNFMNSSRLLLNPVNYVSVILISGQRNAIISKSRKRARVFRLYNALLAEGGHPRGEIYKHGPPGGGRSSSRGKSTNMALPAEGGHPHVRKSTNMALLAEGGHPRGEIYKHGPPGQRVI